MNDKLPEAPKAAGNYVTVKKIGDFIYTSGHVPITDEKKIIGKIPNDISTLSISMVFQRIFDAR